MLTEKPQDDVKRPQHSTKLREKKTFLSVSDPGGEGVGRCLEYFFLCALVVTDNQHQCLRCRMRPTFYLIFVIFTPPVLYCSRNSGVRHDCTRAATITAQKGCRRCSVHTRRSVPALSHAMVPALFHFRWCCTQQYGCSRCSEESYVTKTSLRTIDLLHDKHKCISCPSMLIPSTGTA